VGQETLVGGALENGAARP